MSQKPSDNSPHDSTLPAAVDVTKLLHRWGSGDRDAMDEVIESTYPRLRKLAESFLRRESPGATISATGLVHETYLLLLGRKSARLENRSHFYSLMAMMMRQILCDQARRKHTEKRGGAHVRVPLSEDLHWVDASSAEFLDLDAALDELEALDERKARLIELKAYLGCSTEEAAEHLGVSKNTADRDLRVARAWLYNRVRGPLAGASSPKAAND